MTKKTKTIIDLSFANPEMEYLVSTEENSAEKKINCFYLKNHTLGMRKLSQDGKYSDFDVFYQLSKNEKYKVIKEGQDSAKRFLPLVLKEALGRGRNICSDADPSSSVWNGVIYVRTVLFLFLGTELFLFLGGMVLFSS